MNDSHEDWSSTRRTVIRGAAAGAAAWSGLTVSVGGAVADNDDAEYDGLLVLIYDDSPREDYTQTFPVHEEYGVPGCVAVCPGLMGTHSQWMHPGHLEELYEAGWEVMSHTLVHRALGEIPVRSDIEEGDTEIHVQSNLHGRFEGDPLLIFDGETQTTATVAGRDEDGDEQLIVLEEPIDESFEAGDGWETWVRYTDEFTEQILEESKAQIEEWGFGPVTAYVHTYNRYDGYVSEIVSEYYDAVPNRHRGVLNPTFDPDPLELSRDNFETDNFSDEEIADYLDVIANEPDFGILYGHSHHQAMTEERIAETIEMAQERNVKIVTLQEAMVELGVWDDDLTGATDDNGDEEEDDDDDGDETGDDEQDVTDDDDGDDDEDDIDVGDDEPADDDNELVGFGAAGALAGLAGASYLLGKRRFQADADD